jgi:hypothetical protein
MLIVDLSEVKLPGEAKQNNLLAPECCHPIDSGDTVTYIFNGPQWFDRDWMPDKDPSLYFSIIYYFKALINLVIVISSYEPQSMDPGFDDTIGTVNHDGLVFLVIHLNLKVGCPMDLTSFPYDRQSCRFKFGSWAYDGFRVSIYV